MGFFRDPKSRDFGIFIPENPKSGNPKIPGFLGIGINFFGISRDFRFRLKRREGFLRLRNLPLGQFYLKLL